MVADEMDFRMQTAILAGGKTKELRVFTTHDISVKLEKQLTQQLCGLMDRNEQKWKR